MGRKRIDDHRGRRAIVLYEAGATQEEIAGALGVSGGWVSDHLARSGVKTRPSHVYPRMTPEMLTVAKTMRADGLTYLEIGRELGVSLGAVYASFKERLPQKGPRLQLSAVHCEAVVRELKAGETYAAIARRHNTSKQNVSLIAKKHGLSRRGKR